MIKTLSKIYQFSGKMQGTMKKAILFSVLHSLFDMMSFGALAMVFSGLTDGFTTSMIWMIFGITLASMLLKIYCSYISDFGKVQIGYFMCAEKRIHIGDRMKYMPMGYFNDHNLGNLTSVVTTTMGDIENNASMVLTNILDEATSSVDPENENLLMGAIAELTKNKTVIMIAHRLKTVRNADQIFVLSGGHIVQTGKHEDLIRKPGIYADFIGIRKKAIGWKLK